MTYTTLLLSFINDTIFCDLSPASPNYFVFRDFIVLCCYILEILGWTHINEISSKNQIWKIVNCAHCQKGVNMPLVALVILKLNLKSPPYLKSNITKSFTKSYIC